MDFWRTHRRNGLSRCARCRIRHCGRALAPLAGRRWSRRTAYRSPRRDWRPYSAASLRLTGHHDAMCGIAGLVGLGRSIAGPRVRQAVRRLAHRGPDGEGWYDSEAAILGMSRLAVIDLAAGDQPI